MNLNKYLNNSMNCLDGPLHNIDYLKSKFHEINQKDNFLVKEIGISNLKNWSFDENNILLQNEIGTLGFLKYVVLKVKIINQVFYYKMK